MPDPDIRAVLLETINKVTPRGQPDNNLQSNLILQLAADQLGFRRHTENEQAVLTHFHDLFRTGYLAWGYDISNPNPPFFHLTEQGRRTLEQLSHDPGNPGGYLRHVYAVAPINDIAKSYLEEGLDCYVSALYKASAVMVGAAAESVILELRATVEAKLTSLSHRVPTGLTSWQIKKILDALTNVFDSRKRLFPNHLRDEYENFWTAFTQQIRAARNDTGHPSRVDPISPQTIHGSLLIFPSLLKLAAALKEWVEHSLT